MKSILAIAFFLTGGHLWAQLTFEKAEMITDAKVHQANYEAVFNFKNTGTTDVQIKKVKTSCGCTTAKLEKRVYRPGEIGQIKSTIRFGLARGLYAKDIFVDTKYGDKETRYTLKIGARIPVFVSVKPRYVKWWKGEAVAERKISIKVTHDKPIKLVKVKNTNGTWPEPKLKTIKEGAEYEISIVPRHTNMSTRTQLILVMDFPKDKPLEYKVVARVSEYTDPLKKPKEKKGWLQRLFD